MKIEGKAGSYPLILQLATELTGPRTALIGDAARRVNPLAGQGLNQGFRDVAALIEIAEETLRLGGEIGSPQMLEAYSQARRFDGAGTALALDAIDRLFSNDHALTKPIRSLGLLALFAGAAAQQRASVQVTESVTLSKNGEALIKSKVRAIGSDNRLGCDTPNFFPPEYWFALPADRATGNITINPFSEPGRDALFIETTPLRGEGPFTIYRAGIDNSQDLSLGAGNVTNAASPVFPFNQGALRLDSVLEDRRLLLRADTDLQLVFNLFEIGCETDPVTGDIRYTLNDTGRPITYTFNGDCNDANQNEVLLGRNGANPDLLTRDHVQVDTQTFPIDGTVPAEVLSFRINEVQRPDSQARYAIGRVGTNAPFFETRLLPECAPLFNNFANTARSVSPVWRAVNSSALAGEPLFLLADPATQFEAAEYISLPALNGLRTNSLTELIDTGLDAGTDITTLEGQLLPDTTRLLVSDNAGYPANQSNLIQDGALLIQRPDFHALYADTGLDDAAIDALEATFYATPGISIYTTKQPNPTEQPGLSLQPLLYTSKLISRIDVNYLRREDDLVSRNDRITTVPDERYTTGERPSMGYSVLYRSLAGRGPDQFAIFTYSLTAQRPNTEWRPFEDQDSIEDGFAPLVRLQDATLLYQPAIARWTLTVEAPGLESSIEPGMRLLFAGSTNAGGPRGPGADDVVRVTEVRRQGGDTFRLTLERAPRARGLDLLDIHYPGQDSGDFDVWLVQRTVESIRLNSGAPREFWTLDPVEVRIFQAGGGQR